MIMFPEYLSCIVRDGYQVNTNLISGYGDRSMAYGTTIKFTVKLDNNLDKQLFALWLMRDLVNASKEFILDVPVWGVRNYNYEREDGNKYDGWLVRLVNQNYLLDKLQGGVNDLTLEVQLLDNIELLCRFSRKDC